LFYQVILTNLLGLVCPLDSLSLRLMGAGLVCIAGSTGV